jgi:hypothetical protein
MNRHQYNDYQVSGIVMLSAAFLLLLAATLLNRADITSATLFLCGVAAFLGGVFLLTFSKPEPVDARTASLLPVMGSINLSRIISDMGVKGNAWFIPGEAGNSQVEEFIPVMDGLPPSGMPDFSFVIEGPEPGIRLVPDAAPMLEMLVNRHGFHAPGGESESFTAVKEISEDILECCDSAEVSRVGDAVAVRIKGYRLYDGCRYVAGESEKICTMHPCGICSLAACIIAQGHSAPVRIDYIDMDDDTRSLRIIMSFGPGYQSRGEDPDSSG